MASDGSVTHWLDLFKAGDVSAFQPLWDRYFARLVAVARKRIKSVPRLAADEEDVALSAFARFCHVVEQGRFKVLDNRDDLWQLLVVITGGKANDHIKREGRQKRGGGAVLDEAQLAGRVAGAEYRGLDQLLSGEPTPEFLAQMSENCLRLLATLDDGLRTFALAKLEGASAEEVALQLNCAPRTVERKLQRIRAIWSREMSS